MSGEEGIKMARIEESVEINCPIDKTFAYTTDSGSWSKWNTAIPEAEQTSEGPIGVGSRFEGTARLMGRSMSWTAKATEYEANKKFGKNIDSGSVLIEQHNTYTPTKEGVKFTIIYDMKVTGCLRLLSPMIVRSMRKELKKSLINLKQILET
jgi:uncharacterized membrane protein